MRQSPVFYKLSQRYSKADLFMDNLGADFLICGDVDIVWCNEAADFKRITGIALIITGKLGLKVEGSGSSVA